MHLLLPEQIKISTMSASLCPYPRRAIPSRESTDERPPRCWVSMLGLIRIQNSFLVGMHKDPPLPSLPAPMVEEDGAENWGRDEVEPGAVWKRAVQRKLFAR